MKPAALAVLVGLALGVAAPAGAAGTEPPARFAVVLGYNGGAPDPRAPLAFADDDAARFFLQVLPGVERAFLLTTFDKQSARLFGELTETAQPPTRRELSRVLGEVSWLVREARERGRETELVFYFAGHGDVSDGGEGFVVLADGPFTRTELQRQVVEASPADTNHVLLDACASYFMVARGDESGQVPLSPDLLDVLSGERREQGTDASAWSRTGTLVSTSSAAEVHESAELGGGVFSYLLRSALAGAADADADGRVEYAEAAGFISSASGSLKDPRARLSVHAEAPAQRPHTPLADLSASGADRFLVVDGQAPVHLRILDAAGVPYAELHKDQGPRALIALVGNPFYVVQRGEEEAVLVPRAAGAYALSSLRFQPAARPRGSGAGPFEALFQEPFGAAYLRGFLSSSGLVPPRTRGTLPIAWATGGEPPFRFPFLETGAAAFVGAGVLAGGAALCAGMSLAGFATLEERFGKTGEIDPGVAFEVEAWRAGANAAAVGAVVLGLTGAALVGGELLSEEGP